MQVFDNKVDDQCLGPGLTGLFKFLSIVIFLVGCIGNAAFLFVTARSYQELNSTDLFLVGLSGLDLIASIFLPLVYFLEISDSLHHSSNGACQFMTMMHEISIVLTVYVLLFTIHGFYRKFVLNRSEESKKTRFVGLFTFGTFLVVIPAVPIMMDTRMEDGKCHVEVLTFTSVVLYDVVIFIIQVILPLTVITYLFARLGVQLHYNRFRSEVDAMENARNKRKTLVLLVITCAFYLLYLPYMFSNLWFLLDSGRKLATKHSCYIYDIFHLIICGKCVVNPLIYFVLDENFRYNLKRIISSCRIGKRHHFINVKYSEHRREECLIDETDAVAQGGMDCEMNDWEPSKRTSSPLPKDPQLELNETDHDYEEDNGMGEDSVAILRPWKNLRSTSTL